MKYNRIWRFRNFPATDIWPGKGPPYIDERTGQYCRVILVAPGKGPRNALIEFDDGTKMVVPNSAVRFGMKKID